MSDEKENKVAKDPAAEYVCRLCNLVFESDKYFRTHREHGDHQHATRGRLPGNGKFHCLLCWKGFQHLEGIQNHIGRKDHKDRCKRKGMTRFYKTPEQFSKMSEAEKKV